MASTPERTPGRDGAPRPAGPSEGPGVGEPLLATWLGRAPFAATLERQLAAREALAAGAGPPRLLLVEHPPTITLGRRADSSDVLWEPAALAAAGIAVAETPRGGQATLHAPGQLVAYPVHYIGRHLRAHIERMGATTVALLDWLGLPGCEVRMDHPGVWRGTAKFASIGIHVSRGIPVQGIAVNLAVELRLLGALVSCGLRSAAVTSAREHGARSVAIDEAARWWASAYAEALGVPLAWDSGVDDPAAAGGPGDRRATGDAAGDAAGPGVR